MAGPWEKYRAGGVVASTPGTGPKPPTGFVRPEQATPLTPIGDKDPNYIRQVENIKGDASIRAAAAAAQIKAENDLRLDRERREFEAKQQPKLSAAQIAESKNKIAALMTLNNQVRRSASEFDRTQNNAGGNPNGGFLGRLREYVPGFANPTNDTYDATVSGITPLAKSAFRTPGEGTFDKKDLEIFLEMLPSRYKTDAGNKQRYKQMNQMIVDNINGQRALLGMRPMKGGSGKPNAPTKKTQSKIIDFNDLPE